MTTIDAAIAKCPKCGALPGAPCLNGFDIMKGQMMTAKIPCPNRHDAARNAALASATEAPADSEVTYSVTFTEVDTNEAYDAAAQASEEPQTLADVIEICTTYGIAATLRDAAGFIKGWVHGDGNYTLR